MLTRIWTYRTGITNAARFEEFEKKVGLPMVRSQQVLNYVEQDDQNPEAWLWLSGAVDERDDIQVALENCLIVDPFNERAKEGLEWLKNHPV